ncbi:MAG: helix-turn-helix domain-containing protein [Alphaproteobacteria bacterium]
MEEIVFPNQLRMLRRVRGKRMIEIAHLLDLTISAMSKIEKGYRRLNEEQIRKIAAFLDCPCESLFVSTTSSQPEVLKAWQDEQDRRHQMNIGGGLKILGAGLRYIRGQKKMTLNGVAKLSKLTLSVYHRIEMGQREVDEKTFANIARALGMNEEELQLKIYELDAAGALDELKHNAGKTGVGLFKGGYNDLPMSRLMMRTGSSREITLPITGTINENDEVMMHPENSVGAVLCPSTLSDEVGLYALRLQAGSCSLPAGAVLVIAPLMPLREGDWAVYKGATQNKLVRVQSVLEKQARILGADLKTDDIAFEQLERVVWIVLL